MESGPPRQPENQSLGYSDTPVLPSSGYHVHDGERPQPPVVTPGYVPGSAPSDAVMLFSGGSLDGWFCEKNAGEAARWRVENEFMEVVPGAGNIRTGGDFEDIQLHVEFASPAEVAGAGQGRGNSGIFLQGRYEIQVLDSYRNPTYADGTAGAVYGQWPPLANAMRPPGQWNGFDIFWKAPQFQGLSLVAPAMVTVMLNGVLLHHGRELDGPTTHKDLAAYTAHGPGPIVLQDHGDRVRFRNIWVREL